MSKRLTTEEFIDRARKIHGDKYDYSEVIYINNNTKVKIKCPDHGIFEQRPADHLSNKECRQCSYDIRGNNQTMTTEEFINNSNLIHNNKYNYTKTVYTKSLDNITVICPIHGEFSQRANHHLSGHGCKLCNKSNGERIIEEFLLSHHITYIREHTFDSCRSTKNSSHKLPFDFYLPSHNMCIEFDGIQHYEPKEYFGGLDAYKQTSLNDEIKTNYCKISNISLIRIPYWELENITTILKQVL